ncbi:hypothetical protein Mterra_02186 [Calidithermus terrae]|uniref:Uncharacterized protein n=1 Tax=Calidithermus terrae TaxID=1408545 RepID=A0A399EGH5_9DEIN|nr:hypothetical protein Mterra_02186 [Calidithermus terrae]
MITGSLGSRWLLLRSGLYKFHIALLYGDESNWIPFTISKIYFICLISININYHSLITNLQAIFPIGIAN